MNSNICLVTPPMINTPSSSSSTVTPVTTPASTPTFSPLPSPNSHPSPHGKDEKCNCESVIIGLDFTNVYVKNLKKSITIPELEKLFGCFGEVHKYRVYFDGICFIRFKQQRDAEECIQTMNQQNVAGCQAPLVVKYANKRVKRCQVSRYLKNLDLQAPNCHNLYVKGLPKDITSSRVHSIFKVHGKITCCKLLDSVAFVRFEQTESAESAIHNLNGREIDGHALEVRFAHTDPMSPHYPHSPSSPTTDTENDLESVDSNSTDCDQEVSSLSPSSVSLPVPVPVSVPVSMPMPISMPMPMSMPMSMPIPMSTLPVPMSSPTPTPLSVSSMPISTVPMPISVSSMPMPISTTSGPVPPGIPVPIRVSIPVPSSPVSPMVNTNNDTNNNVIPNMATSINVPNTNAFNIFPVVYPQTILASPNYMCAPPNGQYLSPPTPCYSVQNFSPIQRSVSQ